jgi:hypothetical protein
VGPRILGAVHRIDVGVDRDRRHGNTLLTKTVGNPSAN